VVLYRLPADVAALHRELCELSAGRRVMPIGFIGNDEGEHYHRVDGVARIGDAEVPFCVECWTGGCQRAERSDNTGHAVELLVNRSPSVAPLFVSADSDGLWLRGCGLNQIATGKRARYSMTLSLITPYVRLMNDGKTPFLHDFRDAVTRAVQKAGGSAYRAMVRPPAKVSIVDAAWEVMAEAYQKASGNGQYPANARQIMYAARPAILRLAEIEKFNDAYFTQGLLPDYVTAHPEECADWDVVYDQRGHFVEPHTRRSVPLGTLQVRQYLGERPRLGAAVALDINSMFPTQGPQNRYRNVLFIEKEGFDPLLEAARIAESFDIGIMSTKGMSVTAARKLLDKLTERGVERFFALHDFDVSGFSIFGTLGTDSRRYTFENAVKVIDLGLRLTDVGDLALQSEPVTVTGKPEARAETLVEHGATEDEIGFLLGHDDGNTKRVELNAMPSDVFIAFLERKLTAAGVHKVVPDGAVLRQHARRLVEQHLTKEALDTMHDELARKAAAHELPRDLAARVRTLLTEQPELPWDVAVALALGLG
jgi:hypothetical protein